MKIVGIDFRDGILFVPEVLLAANAMKAGMEILRPLLAETGAEPVGKVVIGTVKGDIHDIGKNLVGMMLEGAGFEVVDLGINTDADKFINALNEHKPDILGMSALLTTTMPYMKVVIQTLKDRDMRDDYIVLVGGAPLNEEFGMAVGADAYCRDAGRRRGDRAPLDRRATCRQACQRPRVGREPRAARRPRPSRCSNRGGPDDRGDHDRHLVAGHPRAGHRAGGSPPEQDRAAPALPGRDRQGRQPGRQARLQRLHRGVAADPASLRR